MKRVILAAVAVSSLTAGALAADLPNKKAPLAPAPAATPDGFDFAFGAKLMSDYISRGITQSNHRPSGTVYFEPRYNIGDTQLYVGVQPWTVSLPTSPSAEVDLYGGVRQTIGAFSVDVGGIYYLYPGNSRQYWTDFATNTFLNPVGVSAAQCNGGAGVFTGFCATTARDPSFLELYLKPSYNVTDSFNIGGNIYWSPNWNNYHFQSGYFSATAKYTFGDSGFSVSGEFGRMVLGTTKAGSIFGVVRFPSYNTWNAGVSYAWKNLTADLRYTGSDLSKANCYAVTSDQHGNVPGLVPTGTSNWCGQRIMATLSVDFTYGKDLKK
jgi:opacity protein-like surface antigen